MSGVASVDKYIAGLAQWQKELVRLREIMLSTELEETIKWSIPCYMIDGRNVVGLAAFKSYFGIWFHQGVLLKDPNKLLINAQEGRTKALRQWRFQSQKEIKVRIIKTYVKEAIALEREGKRVAPTRNKQLVLPPEFKKALVQDKVANAAFLKLSPGRCREYADYIAEAKRAETKQRRIQKILPMIILGTGLHDKYRKC